MQRVWYKRLRVKSFKLQESLKESTKRMRLLKNIIKNSQYNLKEIVTNRFNV